jgi:hypothetical protein
MRGIVLVVLILLLVSADVLAQGVNELTYINKRLGFTFTVPSTDWDIFTDMPPPMVFGGNNRFTKANLAITYYEISAQESHGYSDMRKLIEKTEKNNYKNTKSNYQQVQMIDYTVAGRQAIWLEYVYTLDNSDMHGIVVVFSTNNYYFFCGMDFKERDYEASLKDYKAMLDSVQLEEL